jgi:hypothetical protein
LAEFIQLVPNTRVVAANLVGKNDSRLANATIVPYAVFTFADGDKVSRSCALLFVFPHTTLSTNLGRLRGHTGGASGDALRELPVNRTVALPPFMQMTAFVPLSLCFPCIFDQNSFDELTGMLRAVGSMLNQGGSCLTDLVCGWTDPLPLTLRVCVWSVASQQDHRFGE